MTAGASGSGTVMPVEVAFRALGTMGEVEDRIGHRTTPARAQNPCRTPPSTGTMIPVRYDAAGDSRNAAVRPNSCGVP